MNILNEIAEKTRERIEKDKKEMPREDLIREIQQKKVQMLNRNQLSGSSHK